MKSKMKNKMTAAIIIVILLITTLLSFSPTVSANGTGVIEVKVTFRGKWPILNADVTGEDMGTHEIIEGYNALNGTYYVNVWFNLETVRTIKVKVETELSGIQEEIVYDLRDGDFVQLHFDFGVLDRSLPRHPTWIYDFPLITKFLQFPLVRALLGLP